MQTVYFIQLKKLIKHFQIKQENHFMKKIKSFINFMLE